ncbi:hypothetical protein Clacol_001098 [Clathrus columnatus]|uniref:Uncharacterized protein n=1 Tax=Clathrus columnatus TaxID=1419009 RepID=A0AAV4ZXN9_9AGAM|nr:hypothetical protein Clacol_001098 [Clathrus columnatus]
MFARSNILWARYIFEFMQFSGYWGKSYGSPYHDRNTGCRSPKSIVTGLIFIRTYALCQGYLPMTIAWSAIFLAALASTFYSLIVAGRIHNIALLLLDALAFATLIHQVWGLWKLKRSLGLQNNQSLTTSLIKQVNETAKFP